MFNFAFLDTVLHDEDMVQDGHKSDIDELNNNVIDPNIFEDIFNNQS